MKHTLFLEFEHFQIFCRAWAYPRQGRLNQELK